MPDFGIPGDEPETAEGAEGGDQILDEEDDLEAALLANLDEDDVTGQPGPSSEGAGGQGAGRGRGRRRGRACRLAWHAAIQAPPHPPRIHALRSDDSGSSIGRRGRAASQAAGGGRRDSSGGGSSSRSGGGGGGRRCGSSCRRAAAAARCGWLRGHGATHSGAAQQGHQVGVWPSASFPRPASCALYS